MKKGTSWLAGTVEADFRAVRPDLSLSHETRDSPIPPHLRQLNAAEMRIILFSRICKISLTRLIAHSRMHRVRDAAWDRKLDTGRRGRFAGGRASEKNVWMNLFGGNGRRRGRDYMPGALARRVSEKINSPAPSPGSPRPDFLRDESSSLKPIGLFFLSFST